MMSYYISHLVIAIVFFFSKINSCSFIKDHWKVEYVISTNTRILLYLISDSG